MPYLSVAFIGDYLSTTLNCMYIYVDNLKTFKILYSLNAIWPAKIIWFCDNKP